MTNFSPFLGLPADIIIVILHCLLVPELSALSQTCWLFHEFVNEFGWRAYRHRNPRPSMSLSKSRLSWTAMTSAKYDFLSDKAWSGIDSEFIARPLSAPWSGKEISLLAMNSSRLIVAAGDTIYSYVFGISTGNGSPPIILEGSCSLTAHHDTKSCITALNFLPDGGLDRTFCVGFQDGTHQRIQLSGPSKDQSLRIHRSAAQSLQLPYRDFLQNLSSSGNALLSLSASGRAALMNIDTFSVLSTIELQRRSWVSHLCIDSSSPFAAFGMSSAMAPLTIHLVTPDQFFAHPSVLLSLSESAPLGSAVYDICRGPPTSAWGSSPQVVVSGWYNGIVAIHDLRSSSRVPTSTSAPAPLRPVLTLRNYLSDEPVYSVSCGGGGGAHVAAGAARHSLVSLWDIRSPRNGFSIHAPINDPSPVYALILESSRLWGVTQSRPFVFDFGPGVTATTYPRVGNRADVLVGYYVTKYSHHWSR
ncbi:hypothetical protein GGX14DRAFT_497452, partial [Mycena pura]